MTRDEFDENDDDDIRQLKLVMTKQRSEIARLRELLGQLHSLQNGCPLPKYEKEWLYCMDKVEHLLRLDTYPRKEYP